MLTPTRTISLLHTIPLFPCLTSHFSPQTSNFKLPALPGFPTLGSDLSKPLPTINLVAKTGLFLPLEALGHSTTKALPSTLSLSDDCHYIWLLTFRSQVMSCLFDFLFRKIGSIFWQCYGLQFRIYDNIQILHGNRSKQYF